MPTTNPTPSSIGKPPTSTTVSSIGSNGVVPSRFLNQDTSGSGDVTLVLYTVGRKSTIRSPTVNTGSLNSPVVFGSLNSLNVLNDLTASFYQNNYSS